MNDPIRIWRCDLSKQADSILDELLEETRKILLSGKYTLGSRLVNFEKEFAAYCGTRYAIGVASGTEALYLALAAHGVGEGDEVITSPFTFLGTASAIIMTGAKPVFADIDPNTFNIDPKLIESRITPRTKAIMPIHLYGQMADMEAILHIANKHGIPVVEDAAQAHGSLYRGKKAGNFDCLACYSFYPSKNLGAYGDAGAIVTDDPSLNDKIRLLRNYGQPTLYRSVINGINSRLDELQAAYLSIKLKHLDGWNTRRQEIAEVYKKKLSGSSVRVPLFANHLYSNYHVYVVRTERRDELQRHLEKRGIQTNIYYPVPLHMLKSHEFLGYKPGEFPHAEKACEEVLALPMYAEMPMEYVDEIAHEIWKFYSI
ncbi:DegT/DnrJ/EryC1/StrS family aminotransferase [bacterium]|nr:DegT/DnrJ/EryC1/StrS family aminotransferase [bacterium]